MKCPQCQHWVHFAELACKNCETPLYWAELISSPIFYGESVDFEFVLHNLGLDPYVTHGLMVGQETFSCSRERIAPHDPLEDPVLWKIAFPSTVGYGRHRIGLVVKFQRREELLPILRPHPAEVVKMPQPQLEAPLDVLELRPSAEFVVQLPVRLKNASETACYLKSLELKGQLDHHRLQLHLPLEIQLDNSVQERTCLLPLAAELDLDSLAPGEYQVHLSLYGDQDKVLLEKNLCLRRYRVPAISLEVGRWGPQSYLFRTVKPGDFVKWRAPEGISCGKRLRLTTTPMESMKDYCEPIVELQLELPFADADESRQKFSFGGNIHIDLTIPELHLSTSEGGKHGLQESELHFETREGGQVYPVLIERFQARKAEFSLSLDFGTTACCVALARPNDKGRVVNTGTLGTIPIDFDSADADMFPTYVRLQGQKTTVGGTAARERGAGEEFDPIKHRLFRARGDLRSLYRLKARIIMESCLRRAREWLIDQPQVTEVLFDKIVLSVPTSFPLVWKRELQKICQEAGAEVFGKPEVSIVEESMAAVRYFLQPTKEKEKQGALVDRQEDQVDLRDIDLIVICDCGGGSTDITFLQKQPQNDRPTFFPLMHGGMKDFAGYALDLLIQRWFSKERRQEIDTTYAELIKKSLGDKDRLFSLLRARGISQDPELIGVQGDLQELVAKEVTMRFQHCFHDLLQRAYRRQPDIPRRTVLLLLAGNSSLLASFPQCLTEAWVKEADLVETLKGSSLRVQRMSQPKRCVALGSFLLAEGGAFAPLHNSVPEDILLQVPDNFDPPEPARLIHHHHAAPYYLLFEAGESLDEASNRIHAALHAHSLGLEQAKRAEFHLYTCFAGENPERYDTLKCFPPPGKDNFGDVQFLFTYDPTGQEGLVTVGLYSDQ